MRPLRCALLLVAVGMFLVGGCGSDDSASAGDVVKAGSDTTISGHGVTVTVPIGRLTVKVGDPVSSVAADKTFARKKLTAPDGGSLVPIGWTFDATSGPWGQMLAKDPQETKVSLTDGDHHYPLGSPYSVSGNTIANSSVTDFYVAVKGKPTIDDLSLEVEYAGGTQAVSVATGKPEPGSPSLAGLGTTQPAGVACPSTGWTSSDPKLDLRLDCQISMVGRSPYYPGVGWAPRGKVLQVVNVSSVRLLDAVDNSGGGSTTYRVTGIVDHSTLASGRSATALHQAPAPQEYVAGGTLVFRTTPDAHDPLRISLTFELEQDRVRGDSHAPTTRSVTITRTIPLG